MTNTTNIYNEIQIITQSEGFNRPIFLQDMRYPIIETIIEEVYKVEKDMTVVSERYNPFRKETAYTVNRTIITGWKIVGVFYDYGKACRFARKYAKQNGLKVC